MMAHRALRTSPHRIVRGLLLTVFCSLFLSAAAAAAPITITVAFWGAESEYDDIWIPIRTAFEAAHPEISLELMHVTESFQDKMISMALAGQPADVWMSNADTALSYSLAGLTENLRPFMAKDPTFEADQFFPAALDAYALGDVQFGLPSHFQTTAIWYNADLFAEAGLPQPPDTWRWADFETSAERLTRDLNGDGETEQWGLVMPFSGEFLLPWLYSAGGGVVDDNDRPARAAIGDPPSLTALGFLQRLAAEERVIEPRFGNADPFYAGSVGMYSYYAVAQRMAAYAQFPYNVARLPAGPAGSINAVVPGGFVMGKGDHQAAAWELMKFIAQRGAFSYNTVPAYLPLARTDDWPFVPVPPNYNRAAFVASAMSARPHMIKTPVVADIYRAVNELRPALTGNAAIGPAAAQVARRIDAVLREQADR
ncbi:MAG TPA: extracellular solute-binding protein [Limnochordia bacterium]